MLYPQFPHCCHATSNFCLQSSNKFSEHFLNLLAPFKTGCRLPPASEHCRKQQMKHVGIRTLYPWRAQICSVTTSRAFSVAPPLPTWDEGSSTVRRITPSSMMPFACQISTSTSWKYITGQLLTKSHNLRTIASLQVVLYDTGNCGKI